MLWREDCCAVLGKVFLRVGKGLQEKIVKDCGAGRRNRRAADKIADLLGRICDLQLDYGEAGGKSLCLEEDRRVLC